DRHCETLFLSMAAREKDDNLLFVRERLLKSEAGYLPEAEVRAALLDLYGQIRTGKRVSLDDTSQLVSILRLSGITRVVSGRLRGGAGSGRRTGGGPCGPPPYRG